MAAELKGSEQVKAVFDKFISSTVVSGCIILHGLHVLATCTYDIDRREVRSLLS